MTTTNTLDTDATVLESIRMIKAGSEYVRITAPSRKEAENLQNIKDKLRQKGYNTPIIADIHFTPNAAEIAANIVEKVRINPGNYADKKKFKVREYSDKEYQLEIDRIYEKFSPLVKICKNNDVAMRIGTNHGSLSDRIMNRYGDTPLGMVESALEFARVCESYNFYNLVFSMKSSNPIVVVQAYRLLVKQMISENMNYPLHLGVTEAGDGEDGRIKSALGIGTLIQEGLGDTIRVSLTEPPENEIPVAQKIVQRYKEYKIEDFKKYTINNLDNNSRHTNSVLNIGGNNVPRVIMDLSLEDKINYETLIQLGYIYLEKQDKWGISDLACDYIYIGKNTVSFEVPGTLNIIQDFSYWKKEKKKSHFPLFNLENYVDGFNYKGIKFVNLKSDELTDKLIKKFKNDNSIILIIDCYKTKKSWNQKNIFLKLDQLKSKIPVIIKGMYDGLSISNLQINSSIDIGSLLIEGFGEGIFIANILALDDKILESINRLSFGILQASRRRISKTEYISCPSCGRTLFDLQETTALIRSKTQHLKGLKIGVMGCIVNGPGEMADADYGYVGTGTDKVSLYRGQNVVKSNINTEVASDELIDLIKEDGNWIEP